MDRATESKAHSPAAASRRSAPSCRSVYARRRLSGRSRRVSSLNRVFFMAPSCGPRDHSLNLQLVRKSAGRSSGPWQFPRTPATGRSGSISKVRPPPATVGQWSSDRANSRSGSSRSSVKFVNPLKVEISVSKLIELNVIIPDHPSDIHQDAFARFRETIFCARSMKARKLAAMWRRPG